MLFERCLEFYSSAVFCPASEKKGPKGQLVTKYRGHVEYMRAIKKHFFATKISVVISHRRLTYRELVSLLSTFFLTIQTIEPSMYEFSSNFI